MICARAVDHRPAVAAQRREKMRARLVEAAVLVIAAKGMDHVVIEDVIAAAGVSRGTFYNHFPAVPDLMQAAKDALGNELLLMVLDETAAIADPADSCARALLLALATSAAYPLLARFSAQIGMHFLSPGNLVADLVPPLLIRGMEEGRFCRMSVPLALEALTMVFMSALRRQAQDAAMPASEVVAALLRLLGVPPDEAAALAAQPVEALRPAPDGLIARSDAVLRGAA